MGSLQEKIYSISPNFIQNAIVTTFNYLAYKKRYNTKYYEYLDHYKKNNSLSKNDLLKRQQEKYEAFVKYAIKNSPFFSELYKNIENPYLLENIKKLPIINKEDIRKNINDVYSIDKSEGIISKTGGTTGKSLEVLFHKDDIQERFAILDNFRGNYGYKLGKKTAWFSGKSLLTQRDLKKNRFWKTDLINHVRYYSTFHINNKFLKFYIEDLIKFKPEYMVGFPSTIYEIAKYGLQNNIDFPANTIKAIFPTAETITDEIRTVLETFFKTNLYNQYASSEGAPFIIECKNKKLHLELQSGVFEVLDKDNNDTHSGRLIVTAFHTQGTPLIRYDIGDQIELTENENCSCGNNNPVIKKILGRISDYIFSEETGKINLGNISNCLKGVKGIIRFQVIQDKLDEIKILVIRDEKIFNDNYEKTFLSNFIDRVGNKMQINIVYVDTIKVEKSGKYRLVKNNL